MPAIVLVGVKDKGATGEDRLAGVPRPEHDALVKSGWPMTPQPATMTVWNGRNGFGGPRLRSPRTSGSSRTSSDATGGPEVRGAALVAAAVGVTVPRIAEIADVTEADVEEWLARYRDYEASFTGYPD